MATTRMYLYTATARGLQVTGNVRAANAKEAKALAREEARKAEKHGTERWAVTVERF